MKFWLLNLKTVFKSEYVALLRKNCCSLVALLNVAVLGCAPVPLPDGDRRVALRETTEHVILPTYSELSERTAELARLLDDLAAAPHEVPLAAVRSAYVQVRVPLEEAEAFGFGPASELQSQPGLDQWPVDTAKVDAELASTTDLTVKYIRSLGANKRGLHAIEYLLFPAEESVNAALVAEDEAGARRRQFLSAAGQVVAQNAEELRMGWAPEGGDYGSRFSQPGRPESVSKDVQSGLDTLVNETLSLADLVADVKLGKPLGATTGEVVHPSAQESEHSNSSLADIAANVRGIRNVYFATRDGSRTTSLSSIVHAKSPVADRRARDALADAERALDGIPAPLSAAVLKAPKTVAAAYDAVTALKHLFRTEVLGTLGGSLTFSARDGD
jgi:predicted lipoprotein